MIKTKLQPIGDRIIVRVIPVEGETAAGLIIPDQAKEKPKMGLVLAAGPGQNNVPMTIRAGDVVLFGKYSGQLVQIDTEELLVMREGETFSIVNPDRKLTGAERVVIERQEHVSKHGRTVERDIRENPDFELCTAAKALIATNPDEAIFPANWDPAITSKMLEKTYPERLIIAASLLAGEYDRVTFFEK